MTMELSAASGKTRILIGEPVSRLPNYCNAEKTVIVTDGNVKRLHGRAFPPAFPVIEIGIGEKEKTLGTVDALYEKFLGMELERPSMVLAVGGGIVCDVAGFAAATYLRGVRFASVPTTLLAQVDAAVGGKNGVNLKGYKNIIGTIRQPEFVLCDFGFLKTLPRRELLCGMAEAIKSAAIGDAKLFSFLEEHMADALSLKKTAMEKVVHDSLSVKAGIVAADEKESNERRKLNFGHTVGHAIEKVSGMSHGEAISVGMVAAARLSVARGRLAAKDAKRLEALLSGAGLPTDAKLDADAIVDAVRKDKKIEGGNINFVLLSGIGNAVVEKATISELEAVLHDMC